MTLEITGSHGLSIALFQPDFAQNVGAVLRLGACFRTPVHVVEPCGFPWSEKSWARTALDYAGLAEIHRHASWAEFLADRRGGRLLALTARGDEGLWSFAFRPGDTLLMGRETAGLPAEVAGASAARLRIPLDPRARSLNLAVAAGVALAEGVRQIEG